MLFAVALSVVIQGSVLYDATFDSMPQDTPWFWGLSGVGGSVIAPNGTKKVTLDTTLSDSIQKGWLNVMQGGMVPAGKNIVAFDLRIVSESHATLDRAGVSVIVLDSQKKGVELSFWTNEVWVQNDSPLFTHGEGTACDTTQPGTGIGATRRYRLVMNPTTYSLTVDGTQVLTGLKRDYTSFSGFPNPYIVPNVLWVGDDTKSARAKFEFSYFQTSLNLLQVGMD